MAGCRLSDCANQVDRRLLSLRIPLRRDEIADGTQVPRVQVGAVMTTKYQVVLADVHYPEHDTKALKAVFEFIRKNKKRIASVTLLGDALDCANLSHHTKGKPRLRKHRGYKQDLDGFTQDICS